MRIFQLRLKRVANTLSNWSRQEYGDIFNSVKEYEEKVSSAEADIINDNNEEYRTKFNQINAHASDT